MAATLTPTVRARIVFINFKYFVVHIPKHWNCMHVTLLMARYFFYLCRKLCCVWPCGQLYKTIPGAFCWPWDKIRKKSSLINPIEPRWGAQYFQKLLKSSPRFLFFCCSKSVSQSLTNHMYRVWPFRPAKPLFWVEYPLNQSNSSYSPKLDTKITIRYFAKHFWIKIIEKHRVNRSNWQTCKMLPQKNLSCPDSRAPGEKSTHPMIQNKLPIGLWDQHQ